MSDQSGVSSETPEAPAQEPTPVAPETTPAAPAQPEGLDRIYERMDQIAAQQQQMAEQFGQAFTPAEEEPEIYDDEGELTEEGIRSVVSGFVDERLEAALAPREQRALVQARDDEWEALKETYPDLQDRTTAQEVIAEAMQWANAHNPALVERPEFVDVIEWVYKVRKFDEHAKAQAEAAPQAVVLESAGGASRQTKPEGIDWQKRVIDAAASSAPRI
jgi:rubrerythrin